MVRPRKKKKILKHMRNLNTIIPFEEIGLERKMIS
jgi:hypothetical protein